MKKLFRLTKTPRKIFRMLGNKNFFNWMPSVWYLKLLYRFETKSKLNLKNPASYNEKIQWLKLYDRNPLYNLYADKLLVRGFVEKQIGSQYLIPLIGAYEKVEDINWESLPNEFVIKCTHGSGSNIICTDKENLDTKKAEKKLNKWMKKNWYWFGREWAYKDLKPKIICEKYMVDESEEELKDYKFFFFNGEPKLIQVDFGRFESHQRNLYTIDWEFIDGKIKFPNNPNKVIERPAELEKMLELARKLSKYIPHARVDFYSIRDRIYFGEITFYHGSGFEEFVPAELNYKMGDWLELPKFRR